jgi:predicted metal-binding membrane protein
MTETADRSLRHLTPAAARLGAVFARPKWLAVFCIGALAGLGWLYLALMIAQHPGPLSALGPGMDLLAPLSRVLDVLCRADLGATSSDHDTSLVLVALMWGAMTLAMMLPSAAPMIFTYAEIADTAARKGERVVSPFVIAGGFMAVWFGFAALATIVQIDLARLMLLNHGMTSASGLFSGAIFIGAGAYQFSALKHACLKQCQNPFPFFFANWATTPRGVFRIGLKQGLYCVGCCWAMMLVMFAVGVMNVVWMAALGMVMTLEKISTGKRLTYAVGGVLITIGVSLAATAIAAHWPARAI